MFDSLISLYSKTISIIFGNLSNFPKKVLILLTNPRSGSTWLTDAIRCHPSVEYEPRADLCEYLELSDYRRYPRDLSDRSDCELEIEVHRGRWAKIPLFNLPEELYNALKNSYDSKFAIEKLHPENFNFDLTGFLNRIKKLEKKGVIFRFIYQARDPKAAMVSFMNYQKRAPDWYTDLKNNRLMQYMCKTYETLLKAAERREGIVVDYDDINSDLESVLRHVYLDLFPNADEKVTNHICKTAENLTRREIRTRSSTPFLGSIAGAEKGNSGQYVNFFENYGNEIDACYISYNRLLMLKEMQK